MPSDRPHPAGSAPQTGPTSPHGGEVNRDRPHPAGSAPQTGPTSPPGGEVNRDRPHPAGSAPQTGPTSPHGGEVNPQTGPTSPHGGEVNKWGFSTRALHVGQGPDPATGAVVQPIHMATTFAQQGVG